MEKITIDQLIKKETELIQKFQAAQQSIIKKSLLENGANAVGFQVAKENMQQLSQEIVNKTIPLGVKWLKKDV